MKWLFRARRSIGTVGIHTGRGWAARLVRCLRTRLCLLLPLRNCARGCWRRRDRNGVNLLAGYCSPIRTVGVETRLRCATRLSALLWRIRSWVRDVLLSRVIGALSGTIRHSHRGLAYMGRLHRGWTRRVTACADWTRSATLLNGAGWQWPQWDRLRSRSRYCLSFSSSIGQEHRTCRVNANVVDWPRHDTLVGRLEIGMRNRRLCKLVRIYAKHVLRNRPCGAEVAPIDRRKAILPVCVMHVVVVGDVVVVLNVDHTGHANVGDVYLVHVRGTAAIPRGVGFARPQWEPRCITESTTFAIPEMRSAHEHHQGRRPHWTHCDRSRHPSPAVVDRGPAPIVERGISPRLIRHPGPSPGPCINPMPVAIRNPARRHVPGVPDGAVVGLGSPIAVGIQIVIAGRVAAHIARRLRVFQTAIAIPTPAVELVDCRHLHT